ncbi:hypothetical protein GFM13_19250 [Rhizobium leguminosarum bv. viciae]|nr:hypothetical protein [Rhizobium leguminosarum bv. viciae]
MREISEARFNAIAGYARQPYARITGEELKYFEDEGGALLGLLIRDRADNDFAGMAFGRDKRLRFRWTSMTEFFERPETAVNALSKLIAELLVEPEEFHYQGDEVGKPVDFFAQVHPPERLHPDFLTVATAAQFSSARGVIEPMMRWHEDLDGNFVEQFQSTAFDQRIWELYLFAMLTEVGYVLDQSHAVPDFIAGGLLGQVAVEAVTVGPTRDGNTIVPPPPTELPEQLHAYLHDYMPIKFGSPLFSKLRKEYWKNPQIEGMPLVFAIADFSSPGSMVHSRSALERYLYGYSHGPAINTYGKKAGKPKKIVEHRWGEKVIPSGFFDIPEAENISAVISTSSGTISKFNRLGLLSGFGADNVLMIREGTCIDTSHGATSPLLYKMVVNAPGYSESWIEGLNVYHNSRARVPLHEYLLPGAAHHRCDEEGKITSSVPKFHPLSSITQLIADVDVARALEELGDETVKFWKTHVGD